MAALADLRPDTGLATSEDVMPPLLLTLIRFARRPAVQIGCLALTVVAALVITYSLFFRHHSSSTQRILILLGGVLLMLSFLGVKLKFPRYIPLFTALTPFVLGTFALYQILDIFKNDSDIPSPPPVVVAQTLAPKATGSPDLFTGTFTEPGPESKATALDLDAFLDAHRQQFIQLQLTLDRGTVGMEVGERGWITSIDFSSVCGNQEQEPCHSLHIGFAENSASALGYAVAEARAIVHVDGYYQIGERETNMGVSENLLLPAEPPD